MIKCESDPVEKWLTRDFWDANPCGTSTSWERAQKLRYDYTDPYLLALFDERIFGGKRVLEIGCGQGFDAERIARLCKSYVGIDLSPTSLKIARGEVEKRKPPNVTTSFRALDAENLTFEDATFDVVYSCGVLHHTLDFDRALDEALRVLAPGGQLVLMLYRSYTPLWAVLRTCRALFRVLGAKRCDRFLTRLRSRAQVSEFTGTAVLELFGCPIIDTYTLGGIRQRLVGRAAITAHEFHRVGIDQIIRVLPDAFRRMWPQTWTMAVERATRRWCWVRAPKSEQRLVARARVVLLAAAGRASRGSWNPRSG